jgi:hypothetical protein
MLEFGVLSALIIGITQIIKDFNVPKRFIPLVAIALGILLNFLSQLVGYESQEIILYGIMAGLMSMGLWDTGKITLLGK